jgi:hypothetical protein
VWTPRLSRRERGPASALVDSLPRPIHLYVGRVAIEKNIEAFLSLPLRGSKVVVGDGPLLGRLRRRYPEVQFLGNRTGREIAEICTASDVMVFPSLTETFGHVIVEALACGLPVAAFPVPGPADILTEPGVGALDWDLGRAIARALESDREACARFALSRFDWERSTRQLLAGLVPVSSGVMSNPSRPVAEECEQVKVERPGEIRPRRYDAGQPSAPRRSGGPVDASGGVARRSRTPISRA